MLSAVKNTKPSVFFVPRGFARHALDNTFLGLGFRHSSSLSFCSHDFSELRDLLSISSSPMSPKNNLRRPPDGRVVGSPKRQTASLFWFSRVSRAWLLIAGLRRSHRGTELISSPARKKLCLQGTNRAHFRPPCSATKPELIDSLL
jgi:hypothetical protein